MELAVERRGNVVGNVLCFPEDENVSNATGSYWSFSAQSRVWQEHIMQAVMCERRGCGWNAHAYTPKEPSSV